MYICIDYSRGFTNLYIHERKIYFQATKIGIHEFKWLHDIISTLIGNLLL